MQPCAVCGSVSINAAGYCTQCGTFRGVPPQGGPAGYPPQPPPYSEPPAYGEQPPYGEPPPYGAPGSPAGYQPPVSGGPGYGQPVSGGSGYGQPVSGGSGYGQPVSGGPGYPTSGAPGSGPPGGYPNSAPGYAQPTSGGGYPASYPPPPGTGGGGRGRPFVLPLVALSVTLVILVVAIVIVVLVRNQSTDPSADPSASPDTNSSEEASDVDSCVVGRWRVTSHREDVAIPDVGKVTFTGGEDAEIELNSDGSGSTDYHDGTSFEGEANGRTIRLEISGTIDYEFTARDGTVSYKNVESDATAKIFFDGEQVGSEEPFEGSDDPSKYECSSEELVQKTFLYETRFAKVS
ncbi:MAG TPA: hypothetical protein VFR67_15210 [Pilimelia sp.]|nr:hypothetical protein [Pilimelia sp.]